MGFSEDDRIRHKNACYLAALDLYQDYKNQMWSDADIIGAAKLELAVNARNKRSKVIYELIQLCQVNINTNLTATHNLD